MTFHSGPLTAGVVSVALVCLQALPSSAQQDTPMTTSEDVRAEVSEAMETISSYTAQERDEALADMRATLDRLDAEIERREEAVRENWADMSAAAQDMARDRLRDLRQARNELGERYGALQSGTSSAWDELTQGFSDAWDAFADAWSAADEENADGN